MKRRHSGDRVVVLAKPDIDPGSWPELDPNNMVMEYGEFYPDYPCWRRVHPPQPMFLDEEPEINREV